MFVYKDIAASIANLANEKQYLSECVESKKKHVSFDSNLGEAVHRDVASIKFIYLVYRLQNYDHVMKMLYWLVLSHSSSECDQTLH